MSNTIKTSPSRIIPSVLSESDVSLAPINIIISNVRSISDHQKTNPNRKSPSVCSESESSNTPINNVTHIADPLPLSTQVEERVEPYELVELFYGSNSGSPITQTSQNSPRSAGTSSPEIMQVIDQSKPKQKAPPDSYTCEVCTRVFKEASHYTKHKRGALCRKLALRLAKQKKKKLSSNSDLLEKRKLIPAIVHKPYQCNICGAKFCDKVNVELHLERTHNTKQQQWVEITKTGGFSCAECDHWFQDKENLIAHQRQHVLSSGQQQLQSSYLNQSTEVANSANQTEIVTFTNHTEVATSANRTANINHPTLTTTAVISSQPVSVVYHQQNRVYMHVPPVQPPPLTPHFQPPPPPAPPPMAHMHNTMPTILHTPHMPIPGTIIPAAYNANPALKPNQMQIINDVSMQNSTSNANVVESGSKNIKNVKNYKYAGNSKWNVCGDCGHKFVDPMNLELHIQRKHPESYMIETVNLGGGTILYKTNNTSSDIHSFLNENGTTSSSSKTNITSSNIQCPLNENGNNSSFGHNKHTNKTNTQSFDCILCGYKATSRNYIIYHLQNVHTTSNTNFIHVMETLESNKKGAKGQSRFKKTEFQNSLNVNEQRHICEACNELFLSKAELIRHRIKDKKYMCGVCCHASCSQQQVTTHMATHHQQVASGSNSISNNAVSSLICWFCGALCASVPGLDQHLASHGNLSAECTYCGQQSGTLETILPHVAVHLPRQSCSIRLTVSRPDQLPVVHMVEVSVDGNVNSTSNVNTTNNQTSSHQNEVNRNSVRSTSHLQPTYNNNQSNIHLNELNQNSDSMRPEVNSTQTTHIQPAYACSQCGTYLAGPAELEAHLRLHQNTQTSAKQAPSSCMTTSTGPITASTSTSRGSSSNQQGCGISKNPGTIEFRCEECGFWRIDSETVMRHIQTNHMSGNMLHSVKLPTGNVQVYPINVVTPISTQEL